MFSQALVDEVGSNLRRRIETEDVVDGGRKLKATLVAVALDGFDPFGVDYARAIDPQSLFAKIANLRRVRTRAVAEVRFRLSPGKRPDRRDHAAVKLEVIIGVEDVVLAIVLVGQRPLDRLEACVED